MIKTKINYQEQSCNQRLSSSYYFKKRILNRARHPKLDYFYSYPFITYERVKNADYLKTSTKKVVFINLKNSKRDKTPYSSSYIIKRAKKTILG
jgi:hypothetical protein